MALDENLEAQKVTRFYPLEKMNTSRRLLRFWKQCLSGPESLTDGWFSLKLTNEWYFNFASISFLYLWVMVDASESIHLSAVPRQSDLKLGRFHGIKKHFRLNKGFPEDMWPTHSPVTFTSCGALNLGIKSQKLISMRFLLQHQRNLKYVCI